MGNTVVKRETEDNAYAKFWEGNKVYYGRCEHGEYKARTGTLLANNSQHCWM